MMKKQVKLPLVLVCTLSTRCVGNMQILSSQVHTIPLALCDSGNR